MGNPREVENIHTIKVIIIDILMGNRRIPGGLDFGITDALTGAVALCEGSCLRLVFGLLV